MGLIIKNGIQYGGGGGGGGHTILNASGTEMDQRANLKFTGAVTDDETNDTTIVAVPTNTSDLTNDSGFATLTGTEALTNKTINGYTPGAAMAKGVTDSSSAAAIGTGTDVPTERDIYYGLPTINGNHTYTSGTNIYAPTTAGTSGQVLLSSGSGAPAWGAAPSGLGVKVSGTVSDDTVAFTNAAITANSIIDGPYIADVLVGLVEAEQNGTTITFTLTDDSADGKNAYIWVRE